MSSTREASDPTVRTVLVRNLAFGVAIGALFPAAGTVVAALLAEGVVTAMAGPSSSMSCP